MRTEITQGENSEPWMSQTVDQLPEVAKNQMYSGQQQKKMQEKKDLNWCLAL